MEGAIRNLVGDGKVLNCMCGAFSDKWFDVSKKCGKEAVALQVDELRRRIDLQRSHGGWFRKPARRGRKNGRRNLDRQCLDDERSHPLVR